MSARARAKRGPRPSTTFASWLFSRERHLWHFLMQDHALERVGVVLPRHLFDRTTGSAIAGLPPFPDSRRGEVDVLRVIFVVQTGRQQTDDVHSGETAVARQGAHLRARPPLLRHVFGKLADHM